MRVSLNEIETTCRKVAIGAGFAVGLAEEAGAAAAWLAARGAAGERAVADALKADPDAMPVRDSSGFLSARVLRAGVSAIDLALATGATVQLLDMDAPLLLVGLAGVAAARTGKTVEITHGAFKLVLAPGGDTALPKEVPDSLAVRIGAAVGPGPGVLAVTGATVDRQCWDALQALAWRTYVPESDASRAGGAGAGAIDND